MIIIPRPLILLLCLLVAALQVSCSSLRPSTPEPNEYAWIVLGENGQPIVRVVTEATQCPNVRFDGRTVPLNLRAAAETMPLRPTVLDPENSKPSEFQALACEVSVPTATRQIVLKGTSLRLPVPEPKRIVVMGDTGCRMSKRGNVFQKCNDPKATPYRQVAAAAAKWAPDLVIHVGDYHYRENACPDGENGCAGSPWGFGYDVWKADFFEPSRALFAAAPWVMTRGNHESCNRAGQGWWRYLDPRPLLAKRDCNDAANDKIGDFSDPYAIPLGQNSQLIVWDSSNSKDAVIKPQDVRYDAYRASYAKIAALAAQARSSIAVSHHALLGLHPPPYLSSGSIGIQSVFRALNPQLFPDGVQILLSGHTHLWQQVSFRNNFPTQFIVGNSGTKTETTVFPNPLPAGLTPYAGADIEHFSVRSTGFGFMTMERVSPTSWEVRERDIDGHVLATCRVEGRKSQCDTAWIN